MDFQHPTTMTKQCKHWIIPTSLVQRSVDDTCTAQIFASQVS